MLLFDIAKTDLTGPLSAFQQTEATKADVLKLYLGLNQALTEAGAKGLSEDTAQSVFEKNWPELEKSFADVRDSTSTTVIQQRPEREILEELLALARDNQQRLHALEISVEDPLVAELKKNFDQKINFNRNFHSSNFHSSNFPAMLPNSELRAAVAALAQERGLGPGLSDVPARTESGSHNNGELNASG
ncbi:hypothetical protein [Uliginosibacterium sp. H1]|uniref:hypothetical protein n=1 Tax=Uliginosibacterium sp. H1 TaxID=3114757 RepID=UPI002E18A37B|nr:hypothetical protein [Uliginosibacterium sp. H1]